MRILNELFSLENKVVVITGAAGGICSEMAKTAAAAGAVVALCDMNVSGMEAVRAEMDGQGHTLHKVDLTDIESIRVCVKSILSVHGRIDGLINGAGISKRLGFLDISETLYDRIMDVNLKASYFMSQYVVRESMRYTGGKIINISSYNSVRYCGGSSVYAISKCGIDGMTHAMAVEWGKFHIQANAIAPGFVETPLTENIQDDPERYERIKLLTCEQRMAKPRELMGLTILLLSDASSYMTGQVYHVDGGALIGGTPWNFETAY